MLKEKARGFLDQMQVTLFGSVMQWDKLRDISKNNYELGRRHFQLGNIQDAVFRMKIATWMDPNNASAWYIMGRAYLSEGKMNESAEALRKSIKLKPNTEASYMLAIAGGNRTPAAQLPKTMPVSLALEHFDAAAAGFDQVQAEYGYKGHTLLCNLLKEVLQPGRSDYAILELGTGTGLAGPLVRSVASQVIGVDIAPNMIAQATQVRDGQGRKAYDALINRDMMAYMADAADNSFDIIMAVGVASYVGDIAPLYAQALRVLKPGGFFAFTADAMEGEGYAFKPEEGRFAFAQPYLEGLAAGTGFSGQKVEQGEAYPDSQALICVFQK